MVARLAYIQSMVDDINEWLESLMKLAQTVSDIEK